MSSIQQDFSALKLGTPRLADELHEVLQSYTDHYCKTNLRIKNGNRKESCAEVHERV